MDSSSLYQNSKKKTFLFILHWCTCDVKYNAYMLLCGDQFPLAQRKNFEQKLYYAYQNEEIMKKLNPCYLCRRKYDYNIMWNSQWNKNGNMHSINGIFSQISFEVSERCFFKNWDKKNGKRLNGVVDWVRY